MMSLPNEQGAVTIVVISDLHCHRFDADPIESFLLAGSPRSPASQHPVESLLHLIDEERLQADALFAPGDFANKVCPIGFQTAWHLIREIGEKLGASLIVPTLGNHDIDSRSAHGDDPFELARTVAGDFPLRDDEAASSLLNEGFVLVELSADAEVLILNTVLDHHNAKTAERGSFKPERLERLDSYLTKTVAKPLRIAILHHHPILHSSPGISDADVVPTGDQLLRILTKNGCGLVIHGHKHHPRMSYADTEFGRIPVLASGSFSAHLGGLATRTRNVFHLLDIEQSGTSNTNDLRGIIKTWEWHLGQGWVRATSASADFPYHAGFGSSQRAEELAKMLLELSDTSNGEYYLPSGVVLDAAPSLAYLMPWEIARVQSIVAAKGDIRLEVNLEDGLYALARLYKPSGGEQ